MQRRIARLPSRLVLAASLVLEAGCAERSTARGPRPPSSEVARAPEVVPPDLVPTTLRDRRGEPGVRAPAKPLVLGKAKAARCEGLKIAAPSAARGDLLAGRLGVALPTGARPLAAPDDGPAEEEESRIVLEGKSVAMAVMAKETFQLDPDLYAAEPGAQAEPAPLDVEAARYLRATFRVEGGLDVAPVAIDGMRAYAARPRTPLAPRGGDTALVLALLVARSDGTLQTVSFHVRDVRGEHVRSATGDGLVGCTRVAERIAATITKGPRELAREPGPRRVGRTRGGDELVVRVPKDYVVVTTPAGARLYKLRPLSLYAGSITIALAGGPTGVDLRGADRAVEGKLLGRATTWRGSSSPKGGGYLFAEAPVPVLVKAVRQTEVLEEMRGVAETLEVDQRAQRNPMP